MIGLAFVLLVSIASSSLATEIASAKYGDMSWDGFFYNKQETSGLSVVNEGVPDSVNSADEFISFVMGQYNSSNNQKNTAGAFIIANMMGLSPGTSKNIPDSIVDDWKARVRGNAQNNLIDWHYKTPGNFSCRNTFYQPSRNDIADYSECSHTRNQDTIAFFTTSSHNNVNFVVRRVCANPIGQVGAIERDWALVGDSTVANQRSDYTVEPGQKAIFRHEVENKGPDRANYSWRVMKKNPGGDWQTGGPTGSEDDKAEGKKAPSLNSYHGDYGVKSEYTFPDNAKDGARYCEYIEFTNENGPGGGWNDKGRSSPAVCAVLNIPPEPVDIPECKGLEVRTNGKYRNHSTRTSVAVVGVNVYKIDGWPVSNHNVLAWVNADGASGSQTVETKIWKYTPSTKDIRIVVNREWWDPNASPHWQPIPNTGRDSTINCYQAECEIISVTGTGFFNLPKPGEDVTIRLKIRNTSPYPDAMPLIDPFAVGMGVFSNGVGVLPRAPPGNEEEVRPITIKAPDSVQDWNVSFSVLTIAPDPGQPSGWAWSQYGSCSKTVPVVDTFKLELSASALLKPDTENPQSVDYKTTVKNNSTGAVKVNTSSRLYKKSTTGAITYLPPSNTGGTYPVGETPTLWSVFGPVPLAPWGVTLAAGDQICASITADFTEGFVGPNGAMVGTVAGVPKESCDTVANKPYFKTYGKAVTAGGDFASTNPACSGGGLLASWYNNSGGNNNGSSSQLSALARIKITGFASAQNTSGRQPNALTFANNSAIAIDATSPELGGDFGAPHCLYEPTPPTTVTAPNTTESYNGNKTIGATTVANNRSIFVTGDVYINGDISYGNWVGTANIPSFVIKATGNIYIAPGVKKLDGVYIAKNNIYTCSNSVGNGPRQAWDNYYATCNNQLLVRGTFVAKKVSLMRTYGSLRNSVNNEQLRGASTAPINNPCANSPGSPPVSTTKSCAAEVFDFGPELYLGNPALQRPNGGSTTYDAITSLPPVL